MVSAGMLLLIVITGLSTFTLDYFNVNSFPPSLLNKVIDPTLLFTAPDERNIGYVESTLLPAVGDVSRSICAAILYCMLVNGITNFQCVATFRLFVLRSLNIWRKFIFVLKILPVLYYTVFIRPI